MSSSDIKYSYEKNKLFKAPISGIIIYIIGFILSIWLPSKITLEHFIKQAEHYKNNIKRFTCMSPEEKNKVGFTTLKRTIMNLNTYFNLGFVEMKNMCDKLTFLPLNLGGIKINLIKIYMVLLGSSSTLLLIKIISNYTINTVISDTFYSTIKTTDLSKEDDKPEVNRVWNTISMILYYILNILIISIPIIFIYTCFGLKFFDISNWTTIWNDLVEFKSSSSNLKNVLNFISYIFKRLYLILRLVIPVIIVIGILILPLIYIFCSLNLINIPELNDFIISVEKTCKDYLKVFFRDEDKMYVDNLYHNKNDIIINKGLWLIIFIVLIVIQYNFVNMIKTSNNKLLYFLIFIGVLIFSYYMIYNQFNSYNNEIFNENNELTKEMGEKNVNNLLQTIVKYNYPCMI